MTKEEVIEVEAEVITPPSILTGSEKWLAATNTKAAQIATQYAPKDVTTEAEYKEAKNAVAMLRKEIATIDSERMSMTASFEADIKNFKAKAKEAIGSLTSIEAQYKSNINDYEDRWKSNRATVLQEEYESFAPAIALPLEGQTDALVPFALLQAHFANDGKWFNRSTTEKKAVEHLRKCVERVSDDIKSIDAVEMTDAERVEVKSDYFATLELSNSMWRMSQRRLARERTEQLEREQREWQQKQAEASANAQKYVVEPEPTQTAEAAAEPVAKAQTEPAMKLILEVEVTVEQRNNLIAYLKANNIHGVLKRS